ncbi:MAG: hypothetical protein ACOX5Z_10130 [Desulfobulbus sp.]
MPIPPLFLILFLCLSHMVFPSASALAAASATEGGKKAQTEANLPDFPYWRLIKQGARENGTGFVSLELVLPDREPESIGATELILTAIGKTGLVGVAAKKEEHATAADHEVLLLDGPSPRRVTIESNAKGHLEVLAKTTINGKHYYSGTTTYIPAISLFKKPAPVLSINGREMEIIAQTTPLPWPALHAGSGWGYWVFTGKPIALQLQIPERKEGPAAAAKEASKQIHVVEGAGNLITTLKLDENDSANYVPPQDRELSQSKTRIWKDLSFLWFSPEGDTVLSTSLPLTRFYHGNINREKGAMLLGLSIALSLLCARFFRSPSPWR